MFFCYQAEPASKEVSLNSGHVSPFATAKVLEQTIGKNYTARKLRCGDIQVEVQEKEQSVSLQSLKAIAAIPVTVTEHKTLNIVKGVISEEELLMCSDSEIEEGLREHGVVSARRIIMRRDSKEIPTKHVVLSFQLHTLPTTIHAGYLNCNVRHYVPNPRRCFKCQRFGHGSQTCRGQTTCAKCAGKDHESPTCENAVKCINCSGSHPAYSRSCPQWKDEKGILKVKVEQNLSYTAAKAQVAFSRKGSYSEVMRRGVAPPRKSVETQTESPHNTPNTNVGDTADVSPKENVACPRAGHKEVASPNQTGNTSSEGNGGGEGSVQTVPQSMDVDDCCTPQKLSPTPQHSPDQQKGKQPGRGRGHSQKVPPKAPPARVQAP
ncbi:uncharacterized protein LOC135389255 [Ornithodoros turicata]|uniref:uncharacterized protein LOC135389255 n=1 Tax=Ornithodoros turicata TaxID=34597 RepID=UPI003139A26C